MSNKNLINDIVLPNSMVNLRNNTVLTNSIGAHYDDTYKFKGSKAGETVNLRTAQEFSTRDTMTADVQDVEQKSVPLTRSVIRGLDMKYSSSELTNDVDGFLEYRLKPAMSTLASKVDSYVYQTIAQAVPSAVALPTTSLDRVDVLNAGVKLDNGTAPRGNRKIILNPQGMADVVNDSSGLFNSAANISQQYKDGIVSVPSMGFDFGMSQNVYTQVTGTRDANYDVKTVPASGATVLDVDTGTGTIPKGEIFTIADVYEVNPLNKQSNGTLKQFTVTETSAGGDVNLSITPAIISEGAYQNVSALPAVNADLVFLGAASTSYAQGLAFDPSAFAIGFCDLETPSKGVIDAGRKVEDGISMSCVQWFDGINRQEYLRFDILFGVAVTEGRYATRLHIPA